MAIRQRSRRAQRRRGTWPTIPAQELSDGIDLTLYQNTLARFFARWAPTARDPIADIELARQIEDATP